MSKNRTHPSMRRPAQVKVVAREFRFPYVPVVALLGLASASITAISIAMGFGA